MLVKELLLSPVSFISQQPGADAEEEPKNKVNV